MVEEKDREKDVIFISCGELPYEDVEEYLEHHGKWLFYGPQNRVLEIVSLLIRERLLEDHRITGVKYTTRPALDVPPGYQLGKDYVGIVYCDDRHKGDVERLLRERVGVKELFWKYDRDTLEEMKDRN